MLLSAILVFVGIAGVVADPETRKEDSVKDTSSAGGPHGYGFDDFSFVNAASGHRRLSKITVGPCGPGEAVTYIKFEFLDWNALANAATSVEHGKIYPGAQTVALELHNQERITFVRVNTNKSHVGRKYKTRITGLHFETNAMPPVTCGIVGNKETVEWSSGTDRSFLYFSGASGDAIDNLMAHTIPNADY